MKTDTTSISNTLSNFSNRWDTDRLALVFEENKELNSECKERNALQFKFGSIVPKPATAVDESLIETWKKYTIVRPGDIVLNGLNLNYDFVSFRVGAVKERGIITSAYIVLRPRSGINSNFYKYYFKALDSRKVFHGLGTGIRLTLSYKELKNIALPVPPRAEQDQIVHYLGWKVSEINQLIDLRKNEVHLLNELTKSIIHDAATNGVNRDVEYMDSSIAWIGYMPASWRVIKAKYVVDITNGSDPETKGKIPVYGSGGCFKTCGESKEPPAVLLGRKGTLSRPQLIEQPYWNVDTAFDVHKKTNQLDLKYYYYCAQLFDYNFYMTKTAVPSMTQPDYNNMYIPLPSLYEQRRVVALIEERLYSVEQAIEKKISSITKLRDLKSRLVSDVVTGQIDVRGVSIPDFEYVEEQLDTEIEDSDEGGSEQGE